MLQARRLQQIAHDFAAHLVTSSKWLRQADVKDGIKPGVTTVQAAEIRERRRRNHRLE